MFASYYMHEILTNECRFLNCCMIAVFFKAVWGAALCQFLELVHFLWINRMFILFFAIEMPSSYHIQYYYVSDH